MIIIKVSNLAGTDVTKRNFIKAKMFPVRNVGFNEFFKGKFSAVKSFLVISNEKDSGKERN